MSKDFDIRLITIEDYDAIYDLWNATEQSRRALNPVDDSYDGIERYLKRNPNTCFAAVSDEKIIGVILTGHDGRRAIVHHLCVHPDFRRMGIAESLVSTAEEALKKEGIQKSSDWYLRITIRQIHFGKVRDIHLGLISITETKV